MTSALSIDNRITHPPSAGSAIDNPADWLPLADAAPLTGLSPRHLRRLAERSSARGLARLGPPPEGCGKPIWWLHRSAHRGLLACPDRDTRDARVRESLSARFPRHHLELAYLKAKWLHEWRRRLGGVVRPAGRTDRLVAESVVAEAKSAEGDHFAISVRSLQAWWCAYNTLAPDGAVAGLEALVPKYSSPLAKGGTPGGSARSPEAVDYFRSLFLCESKLSIRTAHVHTQLESRKRGWSWPQKESATRAWWRRTEDRSETALARRGTDFWCRRFMPHVEVDWGAIEPGVLFTADHHQCDFWVSYKDTQIRPWLTAVQDGRSRSVVGWHLGPAPHQEAILLALRMAFRDWAIPKVLRIDNGKDFKSAAIVGLTKGEVRDLRKQYPDDWRRIVAHDRGLIPCTDQKWQGVAHELGIKLIFAEPYSPWSKGTLERWFGTFEEQCGKHFITWCGNTPANRPEALDLLRNSSVPSVSSVDPLSPSFLRPSVPSVDPLIPTLDSARAAIADYLTVFHNTEHRGRGVDGATPQAVWLRAAGLRRADVDALIFLVSVRGLFRVGKSGVTVTIGGKGFGYGARSSALRRYAGRQVLVAVDPEFPAECFAFDADSRRMISALEPNQLMHPLATTDDVREAVHEVKHDRKDMHDYAAKSARRMRTAIQRVNSHKAEQLAHYRATGTDDARAVDCRPTISPVRTGFEGQSSGSRTACERPSIGPPISLKRLAELDDERVADVAAGPAGPTQPSSIWGEIKRLNEREQSSG